MPWPSHHCRHFRSLPPCFFPIFLPMVLSRAFSSPPFPVPPYSIPSSSPRVARRPNVGFFASAIDSPPLFAHLSPPPSPPSSPGILDRNYTRSSSSCPTHALLCPSAFPLVLAFSSSLSLPLSLSPAPSRPLRHSVCSPLFFLLCLISSRLEYITSPTTEYITNMYSLM